jgi:hypothetical protein
MSSPPLTTSAARRSAELVAPPSTTADLDRTALRDRLAAGVRTVADRLPDGPPVVVTAATLERAGIDPQGLTRPGEPFRWSPAMVRRSLGLAAVEACVTGRFRAPAEAVAPLADRAVAHWERTGLRHYHWEPWLAGLAEGGRAVVLAEAVGFASALWSSFDWGTLGPDIRFGGPFDQWSCPARRRVVVKARPDLRVALSGARTRSGHDRRSASALVVVRSGCPSAAWAGELALVALVSALRTGAGPLPARVMGLWPEAGLDRGLDIDTGVLERSVDQVVAALARAGGPGIEG